jgi:cell division protein FtsN
LEDRESLNNILVDDNESNKTISVKKVILVGLIIFSLFIIAIFSMKYLNPSVIENDDIGKEKVQLEPKVNDNNLFETLEVKETSQVSDRFKNVINNLKNKKDTIKEDKKEEIIFRKNVAPKSISRKEEIKSSIQKGYYVQVGAFYKLTPSDDFLDKVKKSGYSYHLFKTKINNSAYTKVVIGPYENKKEAISQLPNIKKIEPDAYILALP